MQDKERFNGTAPRARGRLVFGGSSSALRMLNDLRFALKSRSQTVLFRQNVPLHAPDSNSRLRAGGATMGSGAPPPHQVTRTTSTLLHCDNSLPGGIGEGFDIILVVMEIGGNDKNN
jgi:hypothetical protein